MAEYIDRDKAFDAVDERIDELKGDKEFNIVKEICISGVKKHIASIPTADVVEIPEGATNGDMIKAVFPDAVFTDSMVEGYVCSIECHLIGRDTKRMYFDVDWWNAPYKAE